MVFRRILLSALGVLLLASGCFSQTRPYLTVWLIPAEPAPGDVAQGQDIRSQVDRFNRDLAGTNLTVLNTIDPLAMKLLSWNPEFAVPNAAVVLSQKKTLAALSRFAKDNDVDIHVRFITWDEAFGLLQGINPKDHGESDPDVVQIGSTWAAYFARKRLITSRPDWTKDRKNWKDTLDLPASVLPYTTDVRMLFFWKRLPSASPDSKALILNTSSWQAIIESIRDQGSSGDTIAFPTGLTLNLLHDYVPLVWAGGGPFLLTRWLGTRIDLTSQKALSVPEYLAQNARIEPKPGEPRRLIAFPESSHEEVTRIFVNGGYRTTLEPAAFIDRWYEDFTQREPRNRRFWDYAGAAVPPVAFKGGSDLVVIRGARRVHLAFGLADFLSSDIKYTRVLAEAGDLPAGRAGYGIDALVGSLAKNGQSAEAQAFSMAVQKAIDQGRSYPDLPTWPLAVENSQVIEAFQGVWRRMAEGNTVGLRLAAHQTAWDINKRINFGYWLLDRVNQSWQLLTAILLVSLAAIMYLYVRRLRAERARVSAQSTAVKAEEKRVRAESELLNAEKERLRAEAERVAAEGNLALLLHLNRAHRHDAAKYLGDNFHELADRATYEDWPASKLLAEVRDLSAHFRDKLAPHINEIAQQQLIEVRGGASSLGLQEIVTKAFDGARFIFRAMKMREPPYLRFVPGLLSDWHLDKLPYAVVVILEEWFLNCLRYVDGYHVEDAIISVAVEGGVLHVYSPGKLAPKDYEVLMVRPSGIPMLTVGHGLGLPLIRDILYYGFGVSAEITSHEEEGTLRLALPLPLRVAALSIEA